MNQHWAKSSYSVGANNCVEVREITRQVGVRDSKDVKRKALAFGGDAWQAFVDAMPRR